MGKDAHIEAERLSRHRGPRRDELDQLLWLSEMSTLHGRALYARLAQEGVFDRALFMILP